MFTSIAAVACVDAPLCLVQEDVVDDEPEHAVTGDPHEIAPRRQPFASNRGEGAERHTADQEPPERQGLRRERAPCRTDPDERRRPQDDCAERSNKRWSLAPAKLNDALHIC
jgi:hypothetical protein